MSKIKILEDKIKYNEKLLMETITKVCEGKNINKGMILNLILYNNFNMYSYKENEDKDLILKLSIIDKNFNETQKLLNIKLDYERAENILKKVNYKLSEDITKHLFEDLTKNIDINIVYNSETIDKIKDYANEALKKIYKNRNINIENLNYDTKGLLIRDQDNQSFINNISYDKNLQISIKPEIGLIKSNALTRGDKLAIFKIERDFDNALEAHFAKIKHEEFDFKK